MKKAVFFGMTAIGHINPSLEIVRRLTKAGHEIIYYSSPQYKNVVEDTGAVFKAYPVGSIDESESGKSVFAIFLSILKTNIMILDALKDEIVSYRPDYIIHDSFMLAGKIIGIELGIPLINSITTPVFEAFGDITPQTEEDKKYYKDFEKTAELYRYRYNFNPGIFDCISNREKLNIVYTSRYFQMNENLLDNSYLFIGPVIRKSKEADITNLTELKAKPLAYVSLGTIFNSNPDFFNECMKCFNDTDYNVIMSVGENADLSGFDNIPENIFLFNHVPQLEILKNTSVFVTHGGMNSVSEAVYNDVPMIVIPQGGDQFIIAEQLARLEAGIKITNEEFNSGKLTEALKELVGNEKYMKNAFKIKKSFIDAGGTERGVNAILDYIGTAE